MPLEYLFVEKRVLNGTNRPIGTGTFTQALYQILRPLLLAGLTPSFFGYDKDKFIIIAIKQVWSAVKIQLYFWYAKRAMRTKFRDFS